MRKTKNEYLKTSEVARILGISTQTLYNWLKLGKIPEPERHPITTYRLWTLKDVEMIPKTLELAK